MTETPEDALQQTLRDLTASQRFAVLSTHTSGQPYASLVAFAAGEDLRTLIFATTRATRKYANLSADHRVALLIDSRSNSATDISSAVAATATGVCQELSGHEHAAALALYLEKHPHLESFVTAPTCALLQVDVGTYYVVDRFQHVVEWHVRS